MRIVRIRAYEVSLGMALGPYRSAKSTIESLTSQLGTGTDPRIGPGSEFNVYSAGQSG